MTTTSPPPSGHPARSRRRLPAGLVAVALIASAVPSACAPSPPLLPAVSAPPAASPETSSAAPGVARGDRGRLVQVTRIDTKSTGAVRTYLAKAEHQTVGVRTGIESYRVRYRTVDERGHSTLASGLLVLPRQRFATLPAVAYGHGTTNDRRDVASVYTDDFTVSPGLVFASRGFAALLPDYVGLGDSPGPHPFLHLATETSAAADMLTAVGTYLAGRHTPLQHQVYVAGFSQGASTALGLGRALDTQQVPGYRLAALAAISGGYSFRDHELPALLKGRDVPPPIAVIYTAFLLTAWNRLYGLYDSPADVFQAPYAGKVDHLFSSDASGKEMMKSLPASLDQLLTAQGRALLAHPTPAFRAALNQADSVCRDWAPQTPLRLYYAHGDEQAVSANTPACAKSFHTAGAAPRVVDLGTPLRYQSRHLGTQVAGTDAAADWFQHLTR